MNILTNKWAYYNEIDPSAAPWRPVEPGTFPLAPGARSRPTRLRAYGNAIVAPAAQAFIESVMDSL